MSKGDRDEKGGGDSRALTFRMAEDLAGEVDEVAARSGHSFAELTRLGLKLVVSYVRTEGHVPMDPLQPEPKKMAG